MNTELKMKNYIIIIIMTVIVIRIKNIYERIGRT